MTFREGDLEVELRAGVLLEVVSLLIDVSSLTCDSQVTITRGWYLSRSHGIQRHHHLPQQCFVGGHSGSQEAFPEPAGNGFGDGSGVEVENNK